jgi:tetraacyldisaccharide 4'-kinase
MPWLSETRFREIISGQQRGPVAALFRLLLAAASPVYGAAVAVRNRAFDVGLLASHPAPIPVVSLGNLTTGGTGKTPLAAWVARWFRDHGVRVCLLSRGYRAGDSALNDEALVLDRLCPDVPHLQNPDRVAAAQTAREELFSQLLLLDDGFQHRRLKRDLDIVLIDATNPWGYGHLLPRGLLREPLSSLRRAGLVVLTRVDLVTPEELAAIRTVVARYAPAVPLAEVAFVADQFVNWSDAVASELTGRIGVLSAIGNPESFVQTLTRLGLSIASRRDYPDHHRYTRDDIREIGDWARRERLDAIATTRKDLVKLQIDETAGVPVWSVDQRVEVRAGAECFEAALSRLLPLIPPDPDDELT